MTTYTMYLLRRSYPELYELVLCAACNADNVNHAYELLIENKYRHPDDPKRLTVDILIDETATPDQLYVCFDAHAPGDHPAFIITRVDLIPDIEHAPKPNGPPVWPYLDAMIAAGYDMP